MYNVHIMACNMHKYGIRVTYIVYVLSFQKKRLQGWCEHDPRSWFVMISELHSYMTWHYLVFELFHSVFSPPQTPTTFHRIHRSLDISRFYHLYSHFYHQLYYSLFIFYRS